MNLSLGSVGLLVSQLQGSLNLLPQTSLPALKVDGIFGIRTDGRVREFQSLNLLSADGIVGSLTLASLDLALSLLKKIIPPVSAITVIQKNAVSLTAAHDVTRQIVLPAVTVSHGSAFRFVEVAAFAKIHEFLFEIRKSGSVFWMGAAVPENTSDFTRAQVFFHPTVKQGNEIRAKEEDYPEFKGDWSTLTTTSGSSIQRYVPLQGVQLAAAGLKMPLLVPFTTMAALKTASANMFTDRPIETIASVIQAIQSGLADHPMPMPTLVKLGAASYSSGIHALRLFLAAMQPSRLVKEVIDLDSPAIKGQPHALTFSPGALSKCFTQVPVAHPARTYVTVRQVHFENVHALDHLPTGPLFNQRLHACIGTMMYHGAMVNSTIK